MTEQASTPSKRVLILDTSAFIAGFDPFSVSEEQFTVPAVKEELAESSISSVRLETAAENGRLKVEVPSQTSLNKVKSSAIIVGDKVFLSETDLQLLALALELKARGFLPSIVTDDYSMQNVANQMSVDFASLATFGIRFRLEWIRYCPACHKRYPADYKMRVCEVCGTGLKRKSSQRKRLNR